jgi:hypothetical protein
MTGEELRDRRNKSWLYALSLTLFLQVVALAFWGGKNQKIIERHEDVSIQHEEAIKELQLFKAETESNRFTSADALEVWKEIGRIKERIAKLERNGNE